MRCHSWKPVRAEAGRCGCAGAGTRYRRAAPKRVDPRLVEFDEVEPKVWRRLWVPGTPALTRLDHVTQAALCGTNGHLHQFAVAGKLHGIPNKEGFDETPTLDDGRYEVGDVLGEAASGFSDTYDWRRLFLSSAGHVHSVTDLGVVMGSAVTMSAVTMLFA